MELPIDFIQRTRAALGGDYEAFEASLRAEAPTSIRINRQKGAAAPRGGEPVAWCDSGFYLPERPAFTFDPLLHAGAYYVQEASSMFLEQAVRSYASGPVRCLDLLDFNPVVVGIVAAIAGTVIIAIVLYCLRYKIFIKKYRPRKGYRMVSGN